MKNETKKVSVEKELISPKKRDKKVYNPNVSTLIKKGTPLKTLNISVKKR